MVITLIGLSGCGKSHLARRLTQETGFKRYCCDDLIEEKLAQHLEQLGLSSIQGVSEWMGQPFEPRSSKNQQEYLSCEVQVMKEVIEHLGEDGWGLPEDVVIDTSGSVIYTGEEILSALKQRSRIIYLGVPESESEFMFNQYLLDPKPVLWSNVFEKRDDETNEQALARCYPLLIKSRARMYSKFADVTLVMNREHRDKFSIRRLLQLAGAR